MTIHRYYSKYKKKIKKQLKRIFGNGYYHANKRDSYFSSILLENHSEQWSKAKRYKNKIIKMRKTNESNITMTIVYKKCIWLFCLHLNEIILSKASIVNGLQATELINIVKKLEYRKNKKTKFQQNLITNIENISW